MSIHEVTCAFRGQAQIGESPIWSEEEQVLYWVDMVGGSIHRGVVGSSSEVWELREDVGAIGFRQGGGLVAALAGGIAGVALKPDGTAQVTTEIASPIPDSEHIQFNDARCDPRGRFWAGTMDKAEINPLGTLYRIEPNGTAVAVLESIITSNGLGWSPNGHTFYHTDTWTRTIKAYDYDPESGELTSERVFAEDEAGVGGVPDGLTVDSEGCVWSAKWDGWRIVRYTPQGEIDRIVSLPVARPTSCCFGGPGLDRLYVTTARFELTPNDLDQQPLAGSVLMLDPAVSGVAEFAFTG